MRLLATSAAAITAVTLLAGPTPPPVDATPVLTTTPFGALPGQQVTHTVTIAGTATLTAGRVTFTTTAGLADIAVRAEPGRCAVSSHTVVCDLGDVRLAAGAAAPRITITGRIREGAAPDGLVRNRVTLTSAEFTGDDVQVASNAYLLPGSTPTSAAVAPSLREVAAEPPHRRSSTPVTLAVLGVAVLALGVAVLVRRRRRPGDGPPRVPPAATDPR